MRTVAVSGCINILVIIVVVVVHGHDIVIVIVDEWYGWIIPPMR